MQTLAVLIKVENLPRPKMPRLRDSARNLLEQTVYYNVYDCKNVWNASTRTTTCFASLT